MFSICNVVETKSPFGAELNDDNSEVIDMPISSLTTSVVSFIKKFEGSWVILITRLFSSSLTATGDTKISNLTVSVSPGEIVI